MTNLPNSDCKINSFTETLQHKPYNLSDEEQSVSHAFFQDPAPVIDKLSGNKSLIYTRPELIILEGRPAAFGHYILM